MVKVNIFNPFVVVGKGPSWSRKGLVMRSYNPNQSPSRLQTQAMVNLAQASKQAAGATTGLSGAARVNEMNRLVSEQLGGRGASGGSYAQKIKSPGPMGYGWLQRQAQKHGIAYAGSSGAPAASFGGGSFPF